MKTKYKYIHFEQCELPPTRKTKIFRILNNSTGSMLGEVAWLSSWRQYVFAPVGNTVFSLGCMNDIIDFINQLTDERKREKAAN